MGGLFSSGKSAARRQAKQLERQMELDRQRFEQQQAELQRQRAEAEAENQRRQAEQRAREQAGKLQAQLAEEQRTRAEDEVTDVVTGDIEEDFTGRKRRRRPLDLSEMLGL